MYNTINDNWAFLENINPFDNPKILPNLAGLEVSQFILKDILKEIPFKGYNSKKSLLHQIFRRYSLIVQNNLTDEEVEWRSRILGESFSEDAKKALKKLLSRKELSKITISNITDECGVNRQTFYYHFKDIYDLLEWIYKNEVIDEIDNKDEDWQQRFLYIFKYVLKNKEFVKNTYNSISREYLL